MARSSGPTAPRPKLQLSERELQRGLVRLDERLGELEAFDLSRVPAGRSPELTALEAAIQDTLTRCFGEDTAAARRFAAAANLQFQPFFASENYPLQHHYREGAQEEIARSVALLGEAKRVLNEDLSEVEDKPSVPLRAGGAISKRVFVVHGHDEAALQGLARFIEKADLIATILREQPDKGRTIIEKFEEVAGEVGFAVVLLTPDDMGAAANVSDQQARARQNVVFELGYFAGKLGRGRVCLLRKGPLEIPSDLYGVIYTELDAAEGWKLKLARELRAAEYVVHPEALE